MDRSRLVAGLRIGVAVLVLAAVAYAVVRNWSDVSGHLGQLSWGTLAAATGAAALGTWLTMLGWKVVLADLGSPLDPAPASGVYFVGQLGKYLPGSLWAVLVQADIAARLGVPRRRTAVAGLIALGLSLATGLLVGLPAVPYLLRSHGEAGAWWWLLAALPIVVVLLTPALLNRIVATGLRLLRREPLERDLSARGVLLGVACYVGVWICFGAHTLLLTRGVSAGAPVDAIAPLSGYALSVALGMLLIILPAGLGAREGLLTLVLATTLPVAAAGAVAITSRFLVTVIDVVAALGGWAYARRHHLVAEHRALADAPDDPIPGGPRDQPRP